MKRISIFFCLLMLIACDAPQQVRYEGLGGYGQGNLLQESQNTYFTGQGTNPGQGQEDFEIIQQQQGLGIGYENCTLASTHYAIDIGYFGICQSTANEHNFAIKFEENDFTQGTCIIPMNRDSNGVSVYLGAAQCTYHSNGQTLQGTLVKNRQGYQTKQINSVMVMKRSTLNSFFGCMDAVANFVSQNCSHCPGNSCPTQLWHSCLNNAQQEMNRLCTYFESNANYLQISF